MRNDKVEVCLLSLKVILKHMSLKKCNKSNIFAHEFISQEVIKIKFVVQDK